MFTILRRLCFISRWNLLFLNCVYFWGWMVFMARVVMLGPLISTQYIREWSRWMTIEMLMPRGWKSNEPCLDAVLCFVCSQYYIEFQSQMCRGAWRALFTDISTIFNSLKSFSWNSIFKRKWCYNHKLYLTDPMLLIIFTGFNYLNFDKSLANINNNMRRWFTKPVLKQLHLNGQKY